MDQFQYGHIVRRPRFCGGLLSSVVVCLLASPISAVVVETSTPNTDIHLLRLVPVENPEVGLPLLQEDQCAECAECTVLEWRDADYLPGTASPYADWTASEGAGGDATRVWLRSEGDSAATTTTVPSNAVSIHLDGDANDGRAAVRVDGAVVAVLDMWSSPQERVIVIVRALPRTTHVIEVEDLGATLMPFCREPPCDDVAIWGAAAVDCGEPPPPRDVPALGAWGLAALAMLVAGLGALFLRPRPSAVWPL
jgi:hypothetical protein